MNQSLIGLMEEYKQGRKRIIERIKYLKLLQSYQQNSGDLYLRIDNLSGMRRNLDYSIDLMYCEKPFKKQNFADLLHDLEITAACLSYGSRNKKGGDQK
jgi:hypothetical protein